MAFPQRKKILKNGDIINIDVTVIKDGWYGDTSKMYRVGARAQPCPASDPDLPGMPVLRHRAGAPAGRLGDIGHAISNSCRSQLLLGGARLLWSRHRARVSPGATGTALRHAGYRPGTCRGNDLYHRTHGQCRQARAPNSNAMAGLWKPEMAACHPSGNTRC